jgi:hypothetical protein
MVVVVVVVVVFDLFFGCICLICISLLCNVNNDDT